LIPGTFGSNLQRYYYFPNKVPNNPFIHFIKRKSNDKNGDCGGLREEK
jgi:hypothetical protein